LVASVAAPLQATATEFRKELAMDSTIEKKAKQCCADEHERLVERLDACDSSSRTAAERHRCYRTAARTSGSRSRKCAFGA
jgi:hypothetical protein